MEKRLCAFKLPMLESAGFQGWLVAHCYNQTGNKFTLSYHGSKGYLSSVDLRCEGIQVDPNNRILVESLRTTTGQLRSKLVEIFHSEERGIRIAVQDVAPEADGPDRGPRTVRRSNPFLIRFFKVGEIYYRFVPPAVETHTSDSTAELVDTSILLVAFGEEAMKEIVEWPSVKDALDEWNELPF